MKRTRTIAAAAVAVAAIAAPVATAEAAPSLGHVGSFTPAKNLPAGTPAGVEASAEIIDATRDGKTLVYTDPGGRIGFIDATNPAKPKPLGSIAVDGDPTSVAIAGKYALVSVNTSKSFTEPSGELLVVDPVAKKVISKSPLAGQPDSVAVSPNGKYAAIVIENERDEDLNDGVIPQLPPGTVQIADLGADVEKWGQNLRNVDLTGLDMYAPSDPEPEFVDINNRDEAVVSLQENNHIAIIDLPTGKITSDFTAGTDSLTGIDSKADDIIELNGSITDRRREPDSVHWIDDDTFASANEGDYTDENGVEGGSRTATIFDRKGKVLWNTGTGLEYAAVRTGMFPEFRASKKGVEPEGLEVATIGGTKFLFVGLERANAVVAYALGGEEPKYAGILPTGIGPEGLRALPGRNTLAVSAEVDDPEGTRSLVTLYQPRWSAPYPQLVSADKDGKPIPWAAISGLSGDPEAYGRIWAISDKVFKQAYIYGIDTNRQTALLNKRIKVGKPSDNLDLEGVFARPEGGFWLASEGEKDKRPNLVLRTDEDGKIYDKIELPKELAAGMTSNGFEGVTARGSNEDGDETVYVVIQGRWADDPANTVKMGRYDVAKKEWTFVRYPLNSPPAGGFVGLSEITLLADGRTAAVIERDNKGGENARIKRLYKVDLTDKSVKWKPFGESLDVASKTLARDLLGPLTARSISTPEKVEGAGLARGGRFFVSTDNDGVDDAFGESLFFPLFGGIR